MNKKNPAKNLSSRQLIVLTAALTLFFIVGTLLAGYGSLELIPSGEYVKNQANQATTGELCPYTIDFDKPFLLKLSDGVTFQFTGYDLSKGFYLNKLGLAMFENLTDSQFSVNFFDGKMYVSADIRDSENKVIASIVNNTWTTINPSYGWMYWDRNYNAYAFEVVDSNNKPTFQVAMIGENTIRLGGLFYNSQGSIYFGAQADGTALFCINVGNQHRQDDYNWVTLFVYPTLTNPHNVGVMNSQFYTLTNPLSEATSKINLGYNYFYGGSIMAAICLTILPFPIDALIKKHKPPEKAIIINNYYYGKTKQRKGRKKR